MSCIRISFNDNSHIIHENECITFLNIRYHFSFAKSFFKKLPYMLMFLFRIKTSTLAKFHLAHLKRATDVKIASVRLADWLSPLLF